MRHRSKLNPVIVTGMCIWVGCCGGPPAPPAPPIQQLNEENASGGSFRESPLPWLKVQGSRIADERGKPIQLKGIAFGNQVWLDRALPVLHHDERDYQRLVSLGMNSTRFYLNAITFEDEGNPGVYKSSGWEWMDRNIEWAKKNGIYLVPTMTHPPGGFQSTGEGGALWENPRNQERLVALWKAIAERYARESVIAGWGLLNEPAVTRERGQWKDLAERLIRTIREVDPNHMLFVERVDCVAGDWADDDERNFIKMEDPNVVYEFHFYTPFHFTHQSAHWVDFAARDTKWPDPNRVGAAWFLTDWRGGTMANPTLPAGNSDWRYYEGEWFAVNDPALKFAKQTLVCNNVGGGKAYFDDLVLEKKRTNTDTATPVWRFNPTTKRGFWYWKTGEKGEFTLESQGHGDTTSFAISGSDKESALTSEPEMIHVAQGESYRLSGWMKGESIPKNAVCQIRLDFWSSRVTVHGWDKAYLAQEMNAYLSFGRRNNVPMYLGEWGTVRQCFEGDRGGLEWVNDMLDILMENQVNFAFHDYHEESMGIFFGNDTLPDLNHANTALLELFSNRLGRTK